MAAAVDPTYPLYPIASILAASMLLLVFSTNLIRQSWNLGLAFLCFWLFLENLADGINAIIWADNADIKLYVYCDIVTHLQIITSVVKPMSTLIITRRLHLIIGQQSTEISEKTAQRRNAIIEWALGLVIPLIVGGPFFQQLRFEVLEGSGCSNSQDGSILDILLIWSWTVIPPLASVTIYYPRVVWLFYRQSRYNNRFLHNNSVSRANYFRIVALASIDILLTLPIGIASLVPVVTEGISLGLLSFYPGWTYDHTAWEPESYSYGLLVASGASTRAEQYLSLWTSPILAFAIFGLFGVTSEARASYWRATCVVGSWFGWKLTPCVSETHSSPWDIESSGQPLDTFLESEVQVRRVGVLYWSDLSNSCK
ncbi:STE3-domain-containing protein [Peniophora sp. CONT]|nr:STE3-domain-containing protein [Peniophora sp. CONT]